MLSDVGSDHAHGEQWPAHTIRAPATASNQYAMTTSGKDVDGLYPAPANFAAIR